MAEFLNHHQIQAGKDNMAAVKAFMARHLCATQAECAKALGLSAMAVNRHVRQIRSEWRKRPA